MNKPVKHVGVASSNANTPMTKTHISVDAASAVNTSVNAASSEPKPETPEQYEKRIAKMSDKQLVSEIRKQKKTLTHKHIQYKLCSVLEVVMQSHKNGLTPYLRG